MRIREIRVFGLFGEFDHTVPLQMHARVTILHGPNGFGKSTLLRLIRAALEVDYKALARAPFDALELAFDAGDVLRVERGEMVEDNNELRTLRVTIRRRDGASNEEAIDYVDPLVSQKASAEPSEVMFFLRGHGRTRTPAWREKFDVAGAPHAHLIETQRLVVDQQPSNDGKSPPPQLAVVTVARGLAEMIQERQAAYGRRAQELDRSFPSRVLRRGGDSPLSIEEIKQNLAAIEAKTRRIIAAGLLDAQEGMAAPVETVDEDGRGVLSVFVVDALEKLSVFDDLLVRVELLRELLGKRFAFKRLTLDAKHGLQFHSARGSALDLAQLSSGEQHELVLLYDLLFRVASTTLVMIDEPELSLHVVWQNEFADDLLRIAKLRGFDVLIATHSPDIIGKHWDLTVELKPPHDLAANA
jgi:predicted ATP-binding protein involved in virulence